MNYFILILIGVIGAKPLVDEPMAVKKNEQALTVESFDGYVGMLKMFQGLIPTDLMTTLDNLNMTQKGELVTFISDWFQDKINKPNKTEEVVELLKNHLPSVYDKINTLNTTFYTKYTALKPETQTILREWKEKAIDLTIQRKSGETAAQQLELLRQFAESLRNMKSDIREDIRTQFPSAVSMTEGAGFSVFTFLLMMLQKIVEAAAQSAAPLVTVAPIECALPLD